MYPANRDNIISGLENLADRLDKILQEAALEPKIEDPERLSARYKIMKYLVNEVDNSMGDLQDLADTMEYYQDEKTDDMRTLIASLEERIIDVITYLRNHEQF